MKILFLLLFALPFTSCKQNDSTEVASLKKTVDSLNQVVNKTEPKIKPSPVTPTLVYAICVLNYDYWYYESQAPITKRLGGINPDGQYEERSVQIPQPSKKVVNKMISVSDVTQIDYYEDAKNIFKDQFVKKWENNKPVYEVNHTAITKVEVQTFSTYTEASQARDKYLIYNN